MRKLAGTAEKATPVGLIAPAIVEAHWRESGVRGRAGLPCPVVCFGYGERDLAEGLEQALAIARSRPDIGISEAGNRGSE